MQDALSIHRIFVELRLFHVAFVLQIRRNVMSGLQDHALFQQLQLQEPMPVLPMDILMRF